MQTQSSASPGESSNWLFREIAAQLKPGGDAGLRKRIENDFMYLHDICGHDKICYEGTQKRLIDFISRTPVVPVQGNGHVKRHLEAPRGSFKSTNLITWVLQTCLKHRSWIRILYASETYSNSKTYVGWVRRQIESNERIKEAYGEVRAEPWSEDNFTLKGRPMPLKEPTLSAAGIGVTKTGMHYDLIIIDDPVSLENSRTKQSLEATIEWYKLLLSILDPDATIIICGTRYNDADLYGYLLQPEIAEEFKTLRLRALRKREGISELLEGKAHPLFPHLSTQFLRSQLLGQGSYVFSCQYLNDPISDDTSLFKRHQFKVIREHEVPKGCHIHMLADTATGTREQSDFTVIWVLGLDSIGNCYVLDIRMGHWEPSTVVDWLMRLAQKWKPISFAAEKISTNEVFLPILEREKRDRQIKFRIVMVPGRSTESKFQRITALQPRFEMGTIFFSDAIDRELVRVDGQFVTGMVVEQFVRFPRGRHDDAPDGLSDLDRVDKYGARLFPYPTKKQMQKVTAPTLINNSLTAEAVRAAATDTGSGDKWKQARRNQRSWARRGGR